MKKDNLKQFYKEFPSNPDARGKALKSILEKEGLIDQKQCYPYLVQSNLNAELKNLSQSGASEYLITTQVEEAVKLKPDLIVIGHTSEYRWKVWDFRRNFWQGFIVANHIVENEKYYRKSSLIIF